MQNSKIEWCDHTFNPWHGCIEVSPGCTNCYARTLNHRYGFDNWGPAKTTSRRMMSDNYWRQPLKWDKQAKAEGIRRRVFCASMADVFEEHPEVENARMQLFNLIDTTPHLDWLLLTKRPENVARMMAPWLEGTNFPENIWLGTSCEDQPRADERIPHLLRIPAKVRFLSCEPLLGSVDLSLIRVEDRPIGYDKDGRSIYRPDLPGSISWVIVGGESGHGARPMHPDWARSLRDQCQAAGVAFFMKQWGEYKPLTWKEAFEGTRPALTIGADGSSVYTQVGHLLGFRTPDEVCMERVGKHASGRLLDGRTWDELPETHEVVR
jgi:protein gp37